MTQHHFDPDHPDTRKLIDEHKADRLANPHVQMRLDYLRDFPHLAFMMDAGVSIDDIDDLVNSTIQAIREERGSDE